MTRPARLEILSSEDMKARHQSDSAYMDGVGLARGLDDATLDTMLRRPAMTYSVEAHTLTIHASPAQAITIDLDKETAQALADLPGGCILLHKD